MDRHAFFMRKQNGGEGIDEYITALKNLSLTCEFGTLREDLVKDVFICGLSPNLQHIKERLLSEGEITLNNAMSIAKSIELAREGASQLDGLGINFLSKKNKFDRKNVSKSKCTKCDQQKMLFAIIAIKKVIMLKCVSGKHNNMVTVVTNRLVIKNNIKKVSVNM